MRRFQIGSRVTHGAAYEAVMTQDFPFRHHSNSTISPACRRTFGIPNTNGELFNQLQAALACDYEVKAL